ncbi:hypothetical protein N7470_003826, partial [Penicillium chermesinum]
ALGRSQFKPPTEKQISATTPTVILRPEHTRPSNGFSHHNPVTHLILYRRSSILLFFHGLSSSPTKRIPPACALPSAEDVTNIAAMRIQSSQTTFLLSALLPTLASAGTFDCGKIKVNSNTYDFLPLGGVHEISHVSNGNETSGYVTNTTYLIDICAPLGKFASRPEGKCDPSKNICGFVDKHPQDGNGDERWGYSVAGVESGEGAKEPELKLLKEVNEDLQGLRLKIAGGKYRSSVEAKEKAAAAVIDFKCDPDRSGLEGITTVKNNGEKRRRAEGDESSTDPSLTFKSFAPDDDDTYILKLDWRTRVACDNFQSGKESSSNSWGFFTWLIIIVFLGVAAYLIFGSWLNYNRYGARGWDLLPHGDTLRDVPYIFQDWFRRVVNTVQGGGTRGGTVRSSGFAAMYSDVVSLC